MFSHQLFINDAILWILILNICIIGSIYGYNHKYQTSQTESICITESCIETANTLFKSMDRSADPCTDFDRFVCGRFNDDTVIPDKKQTSDLTSTVIPEIIYNKARSLMEKRKPSGFKTDDKIYKLYDDCVDTRGRDKAGLKPAKHFLCKFGGWPVLEDPKCSNQNYSSFKWYEYIEKMVKDGLNLKPPLLKIGVSINKNKSNEHIMVLDSPSFWPATRNMLLYSPPKFHKIYKRFMNTVAIVMGANPLTAEKDMEEVRQFELKLANISTLSGGTASEKYMANTITDISLLSPLPCGQGCSGDNTTVPSWQQFIQTIFDSVRSPNSVDESPTIERNEPIMLWDANYIENLGQLLNATSPRTLSNYMGWRFVVSMITHLDKGIQKTLDIIQVDQSPPWKTCLFNIGFNNQINGWLHGAIGSMYARRYFGKEQKAPIKEMVSYLKESFRNIIKETTWMSADTMTIALKKLDAMEEHIAYPDELLNNTIVDDYYKGLTFIRPKAKIHFDNVCSVMKFLTKQNFGYLRKKIDFDSWTQHQIVTVPNAYYAPRRNEMLFPAAFLQGVYYNGERPQYLNFGGIGAMIGHEMTHGFDALGRNFDEYGKLRDWWSDNEDKEFRNRSRCFEEQYGNFTVKQLAKMLEDLLGFSYSDYANVPDAFLLNVNGTLTLDENIADNGGVKKAYYAYDNWVRDHKTEEAKLPGFQDFTSRQMFWISFAQIYCAKWTDDGIFKLISADVHTPGKYRTMGVVMNSPEFASDFGCKLDTPMNPSSKCSVWSSPSSSSDNSVINQNTKTDINEDPTTKEDVQVIKQHISAHVPNSLPSFIRNMLGPIG